MKKIAMGIFIIAVLGFVLTACNVNIFAALDKVEVVVPTDAAAMTDNEQKSFINDVEDYIDSDSLITDEDIDGVLLVLEEIYLFPPDVQTGQEAAILAGEISITTDPNTALVVDNVVGALTGISDTSTADELVVGIFPPNLDEAEFEAVLLNLTQAADAYSAFAATLDADNDGIADPGAADWLDGGETGDVVQLAVVSILAAEIVANSDPGALYAFIYDDTVDTISGFDTATEDPLNTNDLSALLDLAGFTI
jgi:hypothetical protein